MRGPLGVLVMLGVACAPRPTAVPVVAERAVDASAAPEVCVAPDDAGIQAARRLAEEQGAKSLADTLAARGLERVELPATQEILGQGVDSDPMLPRNRGAEFVEGPTYWNLGADIPATWEFVKDRDGRVTRLMPVAAPAGTTSRLACGCEPPTCRYGSGCPACGNTVRIWYGPLPAGTRYDGELTVEYPADRFELRWAEGLCQRPCPAPPP